eukprot:9165460-Pyramimonas_sp.AAC.1
MPIGASAFVRSDIARASDLAKLDGGDAQQLVDGPQLLLQDALGRFEELADVAQARDGGGVVQHHDLLDGGVRGDELLRAVPPFHCGAAPLVSQRGAWAHVEAK